VNGILLATSQSTPQALLVAYLEQIINALVYELYLPDVLHSAGRYPSVVISLEQAFYIWHGYYHWLGDTSFGYFVLESNIKKLFQGRFSLQLTASRRIFFNTKPDGTLEYDSDDQQTAYIPTPKERSLGGMIPQSHRPNW
jgi:hypothetical protein